ncbi:COG1361 family protein [Bythopirellula goksoeyrii]|uniref:Large cysteine-rich periplasmic protein OmcB n=1 Tax=Bythopirellula goksoeyrii TaxID=1400387 RepID=A0A5B9QL91_9BACT|nr:DUF11 domain-containing protein [Bythopirellula goksoeyrii]QEG34901.1 Large cysteine-rich periplasmic protein OmcB precursor [Bythopirellula goksoeyrii]
MNSFPTICSLSRLVIAIAGLLASGCCSCLPRIDPSGERCFIWPNQQTVDVVPATSTVGNPFAPPVFTDPVFPQATMPVAGAAIASPMAAPVLPSNQVMPPNQVLPPNTVASETLTITPERVLAPIGSEVVLKAGICTDDNYLITDQKIEWLVARQNAGEIVELGGKGICRNPLMPWNKPKKIDNQYGIGYTAAIPLTLDRGTGNPSDDVAIEPGHAWASITSPVEGSSHITAVAPVVKGLSQRRASATIYWVDVQWTFPPAVVSGGSSQILTTNVRRQSDGTPLAGWLVRYEVADGGGTLSGGQSGQAVEVSTGVDGNASIDVTPTGGVGNTTRITMQIVRPARFAGSDMPRLVVANGATNVNWDGSSTYLPPADDLGASDPVLPIPSGGSNVSPPITPAEPAVIQRPILELEVRGEPTGQVGGEARYEVVISNRGNAPATGLTLSDRFDEGFRHPSDNLGSRNIDKPLSVTLGPGQSHTEFITFEVVRAGSICHDVKVRSREGAEASKQVCLEVIQPAVQPQPGLEVRKDGTRQNVVGETTLFKLSVKNTGAVPLTNVEVLDQYDSVFLAKPLTQGYETIRDTDNKSRFLWRIPRLEVGATERFEVECICQAPKLRACSIVQVSGDGGPGIGMVPSADEHCIEIVEARGPGAGGAADVVPPSGGGRGISLSISPYNKKPLAGSRATYQFFVQNNSNSTDEQIQLRVLFPPEIIPDMATLQSVVAGQLNGNELRFNPVASIRANERLSFTVTTSVLKAGFVNITAEVTSKNFPQGVQKTEQVEIVGF